MRLKSLLIKFESGLVGKERFLKIFKSVIYTLPPQVIKKLSKGNVFFYLTKRQIYSLPPYTDYFIGKIEKQFKKTAVITGGGVINFKELKMTAICFYSDYINAVEDEIVRFIIVHEIAHIWLKKPHNEEDADDQVIKWGFKKELRVAYKLVRKWQKEQHIFTPNRP